MTDYYLRIVNDGLSPVEQFWAIGETVAHAGILPSPLGTHNADPGEDMMTTLKKRFTGGEWHKLRLAPGEYYPRMARPSSLDPDGSPGYYPDESPDAIKIRTLSTGQIHVLIQELQRICQVVQPDEANFHAYGHEIRNLIILACMEVEAQWKNILVANDQEANNRLDYVKLAIPMKLGEYRVALPWYPWLDPIGPFENWVPVLPHEKQFLPWYDAYNAIKHDRENDFAKAKLIYAFQALAGFFVMLCAQYGWNFARSQDAAADMFFQLIEAPKWEPSELYVPPLSTKYKATPYSFEP
jgi:hypothetical protein